jgi:deoxyinosine 3'endonuclease (endonuclease V)
MTTEWRERLTALQDSMKARVSRIPVKTPIRFIGGCDLTVEDDLMVGCFVVVDIENECKSVYSKCSIVEVAVPYIPGLLCFREGPVVTRCLQDFADERPDLHVDVVLVDGNGEWHMRAFGLACYVGVETDIPTIGISKTFLNTGSPHTGKSVQTRAQTECQNIGDFMMLQHVLDDGTSIACAVLRTTESTPFRPVFVSLGHQMSTELAVEIVRRVCIYREPEPLRLADRISRSFVKELKKKKK